MSDGDATEELKWYAGYNCGIQRDLWCWSEAKNLRSEALEIVREWREDYEFEYPMAIKSVKTRVRIQNL